MVPKRLYNPGDPVTSFTAEPGLVLSPEDLAPARERLAEGRRPGSFFAPGCCHNPDFVTQVPVLFRDRTWDVMRTMSIRRAPDLSEEVREELRSLLEEIRA
jgi:hypothetical protein